MPRLRNFQEVIHVSEARGELSLAAYVTSERSDEHVTDRNYCQRDRAKCVPSNNYESTNSIAL